MIKQLSTKTVYENKWMKVREDDVEFPQGAYEGNPSIDPAELARSELKEETGLIAAKMTKVGYLYEAYGLFKAQKII